MSMKPFVIAATVAAGVLCTADQADAQWRRGRVTYSNYTYPAYSYNYSPGVVYSSYSTPMYYSTTSDGVIVTSSYGSPYYSGSTYVSPYDGSYYGSYPYTTGYYDPWGSNNLNNNNWGYSNVYGGRGYGLGTRGAAFGPWRVRW
jgi:hypothetical protein